MCGCSRKVHRFAHSMSFQIFIVRKILKFHTMMFETVLQINAGFDIHSGIQGWLLFFKTDLKLPAINYVTCTATVPYVKKVRDLS